MSYDDFESKLRRQPMREIPPDWRPEILGSARAAGPSIPTSPGAPWWREWLWPCPQAWAGLAAVWALIVALHLASVSVEAEHLPFTRGKPAELQRQDELLARVLAQPEAPEPAEPPPSPSHAQVIRREDLQFV